MSIAANVLERTLVYRAWQAPFAAQKFAPVLAHNAMQRARRVLDVACGPGTNTKYFADADYLGIDISERYVHDARRRHGRNFIVADARTLVANPNDRFEDRFDFILVNSFLHHLGRSDVQAVLGHLKSLLTTDGHIHMLELVLPENPGIARWLARWDRGKFARPLEEWQDLFDSFFEPVVFEPYRLTAMGTILWNMVYFKGRPRP